LRPTGSFFILGWNLISRTHVNARFTLRKRRYRFSPKIHHESALKREQSTLKWKHFLFYLGLNNLPTVTWVCLQQFSHRAIFASDPSSLLLRISLNRFYCCAYWVLWPYGIRPQASSSSLTNNSSLLNSHSLKERPNKFHSVISECPAIKLLQQTKILSSVTETVYSSSFYYFFFAIFLNSIHKLWI
jgi:hypothetical protein